jgi:hypothetical protein
VEEDKKPQCKKISILFRKNYIENILPKEYKFGGGKK